MASQKVALQVATALEEVARGVRDVDVVLREGPDLESEEDRLLTAAWHHLQHFADDLYIREKDIDYDRAQRDLLLRHASEIRLAYGSCPDSNGNDA